jgi:uncharacterized cupredoxin-like copper-binding protein
MRPTRLATLTAVAVLVAACGGGGSTAAPLASLPPAATPSESAEATAQATRIEVTLSDALRIEPAAMSVPAGVPVTFVVTNTGTIAHEFVLGDEAAQAEHETEMAGSMGLGPDEEMAIGVDPGMTKELTVTFDSPASLFAGCHVAGHYAGGMKATVEVTD